MKGINKVILMGYLGQDPETRYMTNGSLISIINLATSDSWKDKKTGENKEQTYWHRVVFFNKIAEIVSEYLKKGSQIYLEGQLKTRKWKDQNNNTKYITEVIVNINGTIRILNSKNNLNNNILEDSNNSQEEEYEKNEFNEDNIPF